MGSRWLEKTARWCMAHRRLVLTVALLGLLCSGMSLLQLPLATSNLDLLDRSDPKVKQFLDFAAKFGNPSPLVVVIEGQTREAEQAIERLEPRLLGLKGFRLVMTRRPEEPDLPEKADSLDLYAIKKSRSSSDESDSSRERDSSPFFRSADGEMHFLFLQPEDTRNQVEELLEPLAAVDEVLGAAAKEFPGLRFGTTGIPRYAIDDRNQIQGDIGKLSWLALVLIAALFFWGFREWRRPLLACLSLLFGVGWCAGLVSLTPGHLTLLSASFASILFGLGIDSSIHIVDRLEELLLLGKDEWEAVPLAIGELGPGLMTAALTSALVFYGLVLTGFKGFEELGLIAGNGILLCLLASMTVLPALLAMFPSRQLRPGQARTWRRLPKVARRLTVLVLGMASIGSMALPWPEFDGDYLNLQPVSSEAARLEREMVARSEVAPTFAAFTRKDAGAATALARELREEPTVGTVHSYEDLLAVASESELGENLAALGQLSKLGEWLRTFIAEDGTYAIYAYPAGNIWDPEVKAAFLRRMTAIDPLVTGMPVLGEYMIGETLRALRTATTTASVLVLLCLFAQFRDPRKVLLSTLPAVLSLPLLLAIAAWCGMKLNPMNLLALPILLGIAVDDGIHLVERFERESCNLERTMAGAGQAVLLTSLTTMAGFGSLCLSDHRGMRSLSLLLAGGVALALVHSWFVLPWCLSQATKWGWFGKATER